MRPLHDRQDEGLPQSPNDDSSTAIASVNLQEPFRQVIQQALQRRQDKGTMRRLHQQKEQTQENDIDGISAISTKRNSTRRKRLQRIDFSSNDYLGLAHSEGQYHAVEARYKQAVARLQQNDTLDATAPPLTGSTGSRLLSGDSRAVHELEDSLKSMHNCSAALICNSGYDANLSLLSTLPCQIVLYDELVHNSIHMGLRLWQTQQQQQQPASKQEGGGESSPPKWSQSFHHNSVSDLRAKLERIRQQEEEDGNKQQPRTTTIIIVVESVYSMDGDVAPLAEFLEVAQEYQTMMVVDEAHGLGVFGRSAPSIKATTTTTQRKEVPIRGTGVLAALNLERHPALLASVFTFGKAAGCHGAVLCATHDTKLKEYWINFAYPLIYSTALPLHSLVTIQVAYETMTTTESRNVSLQEQLQDKITMFRSLLIPILEDQEQEGAQSSLLPKKKSQSQPPAKERLVWLQPSNSPIQALRIAGGATACTSFCQRVARQSQGHIQLFPIKAPTVPAGQERIRIVLHVHNTTAQIQWLVQVLQTAIRQEYQQRQQRSKL